MPRATVRAAVAAYLDSQNITYLSTVEPHPPKFTKEWEILDRGPAGDGVGAVIYLHLAEQLEHRVALGGAHGGDKMRVYTLAMICWLRAALPDTRDVGAANDEFLDSLTAAIQADRTANTDGDPIFQWGEGDTTDGVDIRVSAEMPRPLRQQMSQVFSTVEVSVVEFINT